MKAFLASAQGVGGGAGGGTNGGSGGGAGGGADGKKKEPSLQEKIADAKALEDKLAPLLLAQVSTRGWRLKRQARAWPAVLPSLRRTRRASRRWTSVPPELQLS